MKTKIIEKDLHNAQTKLVNFELICLHASCKFVESSKMKRNHKNWKFMEDKIEYLFKTLFKFTMGRANLEPILGS